MMRKHHFLCCLRAAVPAAWALSAGLLATDSASAWSGREIRSTAQRRPKPSYQISVDSVPNWVFEDEPEADSLPERARHASPAKPEMHQTHFRGQRRSNVISVEPGPTGERWSEPYSANVVVSSAEGDIQLDDSFHDGSDPIYTHGIPVNGTDGFESHVLHPVEIIDGEGSMNHGQTCSDCGISGEGICDCVYRDKGCPRDPCPCPTDEVLTYYRCHHYGHYPTFWRPWPDGWLKYRPQTPNTLYDRYRKTQPGERGTMDADLDNRGSDLDLDRELQDLLRDTNRTPARPPGGRRTPELLPEDAMPEPPRRPGSPNLPPPKLDDQSSRSGKLSPWSRWMGSRDRSPAGAIQQTSHIRSVTPNESMPNRRGRTSP